MAVVVKEKKQELVLVTGASGFLGTHIVHQLLRVGYKVRGTVRDPTTSDKQKLLLELSRKHSSNLEFVRAALLDEKCWIDVVKGCKYVIHTASPFPAVNPPNEADVIQPAVQGTLNILKAVGPEVRRVVLTSCVSAIHAGHKSPPNGLVFDEDCWAQEQKIKIIHAKSKVLAEKAAWNYVKSSDKDFELVVINPSLMLGPMLSDTLSTSLLIIQRLLMELDNNVPRVNFPVCDVRDVANAHVIALKNKWAVGQRHIISGPNMFMQDIALVVDNEFQPMGYSVPTRNAPYIALLMKSMCDSITRKMLPAVGEVVKLDDFRMRRVLHINPRSADQTILDTCHSLIQRGFVERKPGYREKHMQAYY